MHRLLISFGNFQDNQLENRNPIQIIRLILNFRASAHPHRQDNFLMQKYDSFYFSQETAVIGDNEEYLDNNMDSETAPVVRSMFAGGNS